MKRGIVIAVVVVLLIVAGSIFLREKDGQRMTSPPNTQSQNQPGGSNLPVDGDMKNTLIYTGSEFIPKTITVKNGEKVTFVNNSDKGMWVASAPHPVHTDYPEFDAKKTYKPGESYEFIFSKTGKWKFHDHSNPTANGTITVE